MRQIFNIVILGALCLGGVAAPITQISVDASFHYSDTNVIEVRDIELFPDGRIAYGGGGGANFRPTAGILWPDGRSEWEENNSGNSLSETRSVAVDAEDGAVFIGGTPRFAYDWAVQRTAFGFDLDWTLKANLYGVATKVLVLSDRDLLAAGTFKVVGDTNEYGLVRLNLGGTRDSEFAYTNTLGLKIENAVVLTDGSVVATWLRTNSNLVWSEAGRWLRTGERDLAFNGMWAESFGTNSQVTAMEEAPGTNGFVAAVRTEPVGAGGPRFTRLLVFDESGNWVRWMPESSYIEGTVYAIAFEALSAETIGNKGYDRILAGGEFTMVGETPGKNLASVTQGGEVAWAFATNGGPSGPIYAVEVQLDGKVLIGGAFTNVNGVEARGMARIHGSGAEGATYLYWAQAEYRAFEKLGRTELTLMRGGDSAEGMRVELTLPAGAFPELTLPAAVEFGPGQQAVTVPVTILNDFFAEGRKRFEIGTVVTNEGVLVTRAKTELVVLDNETPGTLDPTLNLPRMPGLTGFAVQPDAKMLFYGFGLNIVRLNADGTVDPSFVTNGLPKAGINAVIHQILPQADGKIYVAGGFNTTNATYGRNNLARLNADGTLDMSFNPRVAQAIGGSWVKALALANGDILAWWSGPGAFMWREGLQNPGILRLNPKGEVAGLYSGSTSFREQGEWALTRNEELITYGGNVAVPSQLRKYQANGALDTNFVASIPGTQGFVYDMQVIGESLWVGGSFREVNSMAVSNLARLNIATGALETNGKVEVNGQVNTIREQGGKVYIGGDFTMVNGVERVRVARLNGDGSVDMSFDPGNGPNRNVGLIEFQVDGRAIIGSGFDRVDGVPTSGYVRLERDRNGGEIRLVSRRIEVSETNEWASLEVERVGGSSGEIQATLYTVEGSALAGQQFAGTNVTVIYGDGEIGRKVFRVAITADPDDTGTRTFSVMLNTFNSTSETTVLLKDVEGSLLRGTTFFTGGTNRVRDIAASEDGFVYVAGAFTAIDGLAVTNLARLTADLRPDVTFALEALPKVGAGNLAPISAVTVRTNGKVVFAGYFSELNGKTQAGLAQANPDGTLDEVFNLRHRYSTPERVTPTDLVLQPDDKLIVNREFGLERYNVDGSRDTNFATGNFENFEQTVVHPNGDIYLRRYQGGVARVNAQGRNLQPFINAYHRSPSGLMQTTKVMALAVAPDGSLIVGGDFTHLLSTTTPAARLARVSTNGVLDTNFVVNVGASGLNPRDAVTAIEVLANGDILIGGKFTEVQGVEQRTLALLAPNGELRTYFNPVIEGSNVAELEGTRDGGVLVRGSVTTVDGKPVGDLFKLAIRLPLAPVVEFLWPTNGAVVNVSDVDTEISVRAFGPDGTIERAVLELNDVPVATNSSGNIPFRMFLPANGEHELRLTVTDAIGLTASQTIMINTVAIGFPGEVAVRREGDELVITYGGGNLLESTDLENWTNVHAGGGDYRTPPMGERRFFKSTP